MEVESYKIENESDADYRLDALLANPETRSMDRIRQDAESYIKDEALKKYFLDKAATLLHTEGH
jgi:hypothetical protein